MKNSGPAGSSAKIAEKADTLPIMLFCVLWLVPLAVFWGAAFGPFKPFDYPRVETAPRWFSFAICLALCFLPCIPGARFFRGNASVQARRLYERIGVRRFKRFVSDGDEVNRYVRRRDPSYRVIRCFPSALSFVDIAVKSERAHSVWFLSGVFSVVYAFQIGWYGWAGILALGNIPANLYPILVQRYNRGRIARLAAMKDARSRRPAAQRP